MRNLLIRSHGPRVLLGAFAIAALILAPAAHATILNYSATLDGPSESPPNASTGLGAAAVTIDDVALTMRVVVDFENLVGMTTASHIHAPTAVAGTGTAGVATTTPTFTGFPLGVTSGHYDHVFDLTQSSSYNPAFITANGGTVSTAMPVLLQAIADGKAYLNVHSSVYGGGEIRGFLQPGLATPTANSTWGRIKSLYR
jgi:hypothetical protein